MKHALLIIDVQNDYFEGGKFELYKSRDALANIIKVLAKFREKGLPVIHVQHLMGADGPFFVEDTPGAQIHESLTPLANEYHLVKHLPSCFPGTNLKDILKNNNIDNLVVCGMMSHMCVDTTIRNCQDVGLKVTLLDDACTTRDLEYFGEVIPAQTVHKTSMAALAYLGGMFATLIKTSDLVI